MMKKKMSLTCVGIALFMCCLSMDIRAQNNFPRDETWVANNIVYTVVRTADTVYLGGSFTYVGPSTGYAIPVDLGSGAVAMPYQKFNSTVYACVADGAGGWYIAGAFTLVGTTTRNRLAHILPDGTLDTAWNPNVAGTNATVRTLALSNGILYLGGSFTGVGGQTRANIAALDAATGTPTAWNPGADNLVHAMIVDGGTIYAAGSFTTVGGQTRNCMASFDEATGSLNAWDPNASGAAPVVYTLAVSGTNIYAGGLYSNIGGQARTNLAALDISTGAATAWNPAPNNNVFALAAADGILYVGGQFTTTSATARNRIAAYTIATDTLTTWNPNANNVVNSIMVSGTVAYVGGSFTTIGGQTRARVAALNTSGTGTATAWNPGAGNVVRAFSISGSNMYLGGSFTTTHGQIRNYIAALDAVTGIPTTWNPNANNNVFAMMMSGTTLYVGGQFTNIGGAARNRIAALNASGTSTTWNPNAGAIVYALADGGSVIYAGGAFTTVGALTRNRIAAIDVSTGVASAFDANADNTVFALSLLDGTLYAGGSFLNVGGLARSGIAALDGTTGTPTAWDPVAGGTAPVVRALAASGTTVYAGGEFTTMGGLTRNRIAALDTTTGAPTTWNPSANNIVFALAFGDQKMYVAGQFTSIGGQTRNRLAALNLSGTGTATGWNPNANTIGRALAVSGGTVYAGGEFTVVQSQVRSYFAQFDTPPPPVAPDTPGATAIGLNTITWTWQDNSDNETGFKVYADPGAGPPATLRTTTAAGVISWAYPSLAANSQYAFQVAATNPGGDSALTSVYSEWTLIQPVTALVFSNVTEAGISVAPSNTPSNLAAGNSGIQFTNATSGESSAWQQAVTPWASTALTPNTLYSFSGQSRNGASVTTVAATGTRYTLAAAPVVGENIACDRTLSQPYLPGTVFTFSNPAGFGEGTHGGGSYQASSFRYLWNTNATHTFAGTEASWSSGDLIQTVTLTGQYYLHLQSLNAQGTASGVLDFGPFILDADPPAVPMVSGPVLTNNVRPTWTWTAGGGGNGTFIIDLDNAEVWAETTLTTYTPDVDLTDGVHTLRVRERDETGNWSVEGSHTLTISTAALGASLLLSGAEETSADVLAFSVVFSQPVAPTFAPGVISLTGTLAGAVAISGADPSYTVTVTLADPDADGTLGISVTGGAVQEAFGNTYAGGTSPQYRVYNWHTPKFLVTPVNTKAYAGDNQTFIVTPNCLAPSTAYQWKWNDGAKTEYLGPNTPSWTLPDLTENQAGTYWCEVSYDGETNAITPVTLSVRPPLQITQQPEGADKITGESHKFTVTASGGYLPRSYQWQKSGNPLPQAPDGPSFQISDLKVADSGSYTVLISDDNTAVIESDPAQLQVSVGVPVAGISARALLAAILLAAGAAALAYRRRKAVRG